MKNLCMAVMLIFTFPLYGSICYAQGQAPVGYNLGTKKNCAEIVGKSRATMALIGFEEKYAQKALKDKDWAKLDKWTNKRDASVKLMASYSTIYKTWCDWYPWR